MSYDLKNIGSLPTVKNQPAYTGDVLAYIDAVVSVAAFEGAATAPPGTRAHMQVRPVGQTAWYAWGPVADLTVENIGHALEACIDVDGDDGRVEIEVVWMTDAEFDAMPEFDGW
jgi:hypothetical protein